MKKRRILSLIMLLILAAQPFLAVPVFSQVTTYYIYFSSWDGSSWSTPHQIVQVDYLNATWNSFQRKTWKTEEGCYFIVFFQLDSNTLEYVASTDGEVWEPSTQLFLFSTYPHGGFDVEYPSYDNYYVPHEGIMAYTGSADGAYYLPFNVSGTTIQKLTGAADGSHWPNGISIASSLAGDFSYRVFHRNRIIVPIQNDTLLLRAPAIQEDLDLSMPYGDGMSIGCQVLRYLTESPYDMLTIQKAGNQSFHYNVIDATARDWMYDSFLPLSATGGHSHEDWCATSEAEQLGDPERIHLVFADVASSELYYMKFESDAWNSPAALGVTGNYVTLNVDDSGNLLLTYVSANSIYYMTKPSGGSWSSPNVLTTANNPGYCSSNHNEQDGEILLIYTDSVTTSTIQSSASENLAIAAALMISCFILVFIIHLVYALSSGKTENLVAILSSYIIGAIIIAALSVIMLSL